MAGGVSVLYNPLVFSPHFFGSLNFHPREGTRLFSHFMVAFYYLYNLYERVSERGGGRVRISWIGHWWVHQDGQRIWGWLYLTFYNSSMAGKLQVERSSCLAFGMPSFSLIYNYHYNKLHTTNCFIFGGLNPEVRDATVLCFSLNPDVSHILHVESSN